MTGSSGLIGRTLSTLLTSKGIEVVKFDLQPSSETGCLDIRDGRAVDAAMSGIDGVIHLAAVSRVLVAEADAKTCWATNVMGLRNVIESMFMTRPRSWLIFASSREVYGQSARQPVKEQFDTRPVSTYGASKLEGERLVLQARNCGLQTAVVRLSNVYGCVHDHPTRVAPAFARAAAAAGQLRVDCATSAFDFTHVQDVCDGIWRLADLLSKQPWEPFPIHLVSGRATSLTELATLAQSCSRVPSTMVYGQPRVNAVTHFRGDPARAAALLGWRAATRLEDGMRRLVDKFAQLHNGPSGITHG